MTTPTYQRDEPDYDMNIHSNPDAMAWAKFFKETCNKLGKECDVEWMHGWFANAMMAMHDHLMQTRVKELESRLASALEAKEKANLPENDTPENIHDNPKSWIAWKREAERAHAENAKLQNEIKEYLEAHEITATSYVLIKYERDDLRVRLEKAEAINREWDQVRTRQEYELVALRMENAAMKDALKTAYDAFYHNGNEEWPSAKKVKKVLDGIKQNNNL